MDPTLVQKLGNKALAKGIRGSEVSFGTPKFQKAFADYTKGQNISYTPKAAHAYDAAWALMEAYARAPEKMGSDILDALKDLKFEVRFEAEGLGGGGCDHCVRGAWTEDGERHPGCPQGPQVRGGT